MKHDSVTGWHSGTHSAAAQLLTGGGGGGVHVFLV